ncbi:MAG: MFS transporter [Gammaproteobacteria bacterium]|nr:MAG: MFS transporter [Gammaproteobacteria bacterium]
MKPLRQLFRSLGCRDYRLYFFGQLASLHGSWMQQVAQSWLVYRLTGSNWMLGVVSAAGLAPSLLFGLWGGMVADRVPRRRLFLLCQWLALAQAVALAVLTLGGWVRPWQVVVLAFLVGVVHAFEIPARHALVGTLVPRELMHNAVALNSSTFNLARALGPVTAGLLIPHTGEGGIFLVNAASYLAVILALSRMSGADPAPRHAAGDGLLGGLRHVWRHPGLRAAVLLVGLSSLLVNPYLVLLPDFARRVLTGGAEEYGVLVGAAGFGSLLGALHLALRARPTGLERLVALASLGASLGLVGLALCRTPIPAAGFLCLTGLALTTQVAGTNTYLQVSAPDRLRGRIMSLFSVVFLGFSPLGSLVAGGLADRLGVLPVLAGLGLVLLVVGMPWRLRLWFLEGASR